MERNASELTVKSYREDLTALAEYLGEARGGPCPEPGSLDVLELRGYVAALHEAGYAKSTIARRLASLRSFFRFGQRDGWAKGNPAKPLRNPRRGRTLPHFLSAEEIGRLLWSPPADRPMGLRDRAILETMYAAGLRVSEVVGLEQGDLDLEAGILRVRGKGRRERLAPDRLLRVRRLAALAGGAATPSARSLPGRNRRCSSTSSAAGSPRGAWGGCWKSTSASPAWTPAPRRIRCGTVSPPTSWTAAPTSAACRSCWGIRA